MRRTVQDTFLAHANTGGAVKAWYANEGCRKKADSGCYVHDMDCPPNVCNLFGYSHLRFLTFPDVSVLDDVEQAVLDPIIKAMHVNLCDSVDEQFEYFMNWLAVKVQDPNRKNGTMIWFCGPQGSGKGMFIDRLIGKGLFGAASSYGQVSSVSDLLGDFNDHMELWFLVMVDDAVESADRARPPTSRRQAESLKSLISEDTFMLKAKYRTAREVPNHMDFIGASNVAEPVRMDGDDRRMVLIETSSQNVMNLPYWDELHALARRSDIQRLLYRWLKNRDVTLFNANRIPTSGLRRSVQVSSRPFMCGFLQDVVSADPPLGKLADDPPWVLKDELYHAMREYYGRNHDGVRKPSMGDMVKEIHRLKYPPGPGQKWLNVVTLEGSTRSGNKKVYVVSPSLAMVAENMKKAGWMWDENA